MLSKVSPHSFSTSSNVSCLPGVTLRKTEQYIALSFLKPRTILSSAVLNGGSVKANHILNMRVPENFLGKKQVLETPEETLRIHGEKWNLEPQNCVGMMTSAHMNTFRMASRTEGEVTVECYLTAGISNARCAGDPAEWRQFVEDSKESTDSKALNKKSSGTINIILGTNGAFTPAAQVECISLVAEAKADVLRQMNVLSPVSQKIATGTGTDSTVVFGGEETPIVYCGKHVLFGEMVASVVQEALGSSLQSLGHVEKGKKTPCK